MKPSERIKEIYAAMTTLEGISGAEMKLYEVLAVMRYLDEKENFLKN